VSATPVSGIVLAGGRSMRFGRDKLAEPVEGGPLIHRAIGAVASVCTEVLVALSVEGASPDLAEVAVPVRIVRDPGPDAGPLGGILAGLEAAREPFVLVAAGDMPSLRPDVLGLLVRRLEAEGIEAVTLTYRGRLEPLPCALRNGAALVAARRLAANSERSVRALLAAIRTVSLDEMEWRALDPSAATLRDVDEPADLTR